MALVAGSALALTTCPAASAAQPGHPPATAAAGCSRHAQAVALAPNGKAVWRTNLPASTLELQTAFTPAVGATASYWPQDGIVHALRNKDGKQLWQLKQGYSLNGVWLNHGIVSVLSDDFGGGGVLAGYVATTGRVKWRVKIPGKGLTIDGPLATADGGLAWVRADGVLQVLDLTTGKARFSVREGTAAQIAKQFPQLQLLGGRVYYLAGGRLSAYNDKTGALAWSVHGAPVHTAMSQAGGAIVLLGGWSDGPLALGAVNPANGTRLWKVDEAYPLAIMSSGFGQIALATEPGSTAPHELLVNATNGSVEWQTDTAVNPTAVVIRAHDTISVEGTSDYDKPALLVDRRSSDGAVLWQTTLHHAAATATRLHVTGTVVILEPSTEFAHPYNPLYAFSLASGHPAWSNGTVRPLQAPPVIQGRQLLLTSGDDPDLCDS